MAGNGQFLLWLWFKYPFYLTEAFQIFDTVPDAMIDSGQVRGSHYAGLGTLGALHTQTAGIGKELTDEVIA